MNGVYESDLEVGAVYEIGTAACSVIASFSEYAEDGAPRFKPLGTCFPFRVNPKGFIEFDPRPDHIWEKSTKD